MSSVIVLSKESYIKILEHADDEHGDVRVSKYE